jgi:hypothetical protein
MTDLYSSGIDLSLEQQITAVALAFDLHGDTSQKPAHICMALWSYGITQT